MSYEKFQPRLLTTPGAKTKLSKTQTDHLSITKMSFKCFSTEINITIFKYWYKNLFQSIPVNLKHTKLKDKYVFGSKEN